jgi:hypothetical protein
VRRSARRRPMELNPVKIPTKAITLCLPRDPVASEAGSWAAPAPSPGLRSHATETESGREESGQRDRAGAAAREKATSAAQRNPARPKRTHAAEKAGVEKSRRSAPARREEAVAVEKKTLGELGMAASGGTAPSARCL